MITTSLRATTTVARFIPRRLATETPQARTRDHPNRREHETEILEWGPPGGATCEVFVSAGYDDFGYGERAELPTYAGMAHLVVRMFPENSLAPSHTPDDLFSPLHGCQLVAPFHNG